MNFFGFGLGYCAQDFLARYGSAFDVVAGTVRSNYAAACLADSRIKAFVFDSERTDPGIAEALAGTDVLLVSIPPGASTDPVLAKFGRLLAGLDRRLTIVYLSTLGVYGDRGGEWVDERRLPAPKQQRSITRLHAERAWIGLAKDVRKTIHILRLAGIYGPGRNALVNLREGTAQRIIKQDQVFNRIHVADISAAVAAAISSDAGEIFNVADDEPAPPQDVIAYAAELMGIAPPPEQPIETAELSPLARSFYEENKRASNRKLKEKLGVTLTYPTYREGLAALWAAGEGRR